MPTIGQKIKKLHLGKELSQEELAELANVERQTVNKWEKDRSIPNIDNLTILSNIFDVTVEQLTATNGAELVEINPKSDDIDIPISTPIDVAAEVAATDDSARDKTCPSVKWTVGVVLSCVFPVFDFVCFIIYLITEFIVIDASDVYSTNIINPLFMWFLFACTLISIVTLTILIVYRIRKNK